MDQEKSCGGVIEGELICYRLKGVFLALTLIMLYLIDIGLWSIAIN